MSSISDTPLRWPVWRDTFRIASRSRRGRRLNGGINVRVARSAVPIAVHVLLTGCAESSTSGPSSSAPSSASRAAADATAAPSACTDSDDPRLKTVTIADTGDALKVNWQTQSLNAAQTTLWSVMVTGADGGIYQLGVKQIGEQAQSWVFDFGTATQREVSAPGEAEVSSTGASELFPNVELSKLGSSFKWTGTLNIDGKDVATCPGSGSDLSFTR